MDEFEQIAVAVHQQGLIGSLKEVVRPFFAPVGPVV
jgi:hypothetical protein